MAYINYNQAFEFGKVMLKANLKFSYNLHSVKNKHF